MAINGDFKKITLHLYTNFFFQNRNKSLSPNVEKKGVLKPPTFL